MSFYLFLCFIVAAIGAVGAFLIKTGDDRGSFVGGVLLIVIAVLIFIPVLNGVYQYTKEEYESMYPPTNEKIVSFIEP